MRRFVVIAAGPLASALVAAPCWIAIRAAAAQPKWILDQIFLVGLWSVLLAAGGVLPDRSGTALSDGAQLRMLIHGGDSAQ